MNGNTKTEVHTTGINKIAIIGMKMLFIFQVLTHLTKYPAAKPINIAAKSDSETLVSNPFQGIFSSACGIPLDPFIFHQKYKEDFAATNVEINPGANAALPPIESAMKAPITPINKRNPTSAASFAIKKPLLVNISLCD